MSLGDEIFFFLAQSPGNYRDLRRRMSGNLYFEEQLQAKFAKRKEQARQERALRITLSKLKARGLVKNNDHLWQLTDTGLAWFKKYSLFKKHFALSPSPKSKRKMIIAFDIPENQRRSRDWLRIELISLKFKMLQKSVWLGPAPLPKGFVDHLKNMDIFPYLKFFEVKETDIV